MPWELRWVCFEPVSIQRDTQVLAGSFSLNGFKFSCVLQKMLQVQCGKGFWDRNAAGRFDKVVQCGHDDFTLLGSTLIRIIAFPKPKEHNRRFSRPLTKGMVLPRIAFELRGGRGHVDATLLHVAQPSNWAHFIRRLLYV